MGHRQLAAAAAAYFTLSGCSYDAPRCSDPDPPTWCYGAGDGDGGGVIEDGGAGADAPPITPPVGKPTDDMVRVDAGPFWRGCNQANKALYPCEENNLFDDELPYRQVTLSAYWIDKTEVTQSAYAACVAAMACTVPMPAPEGDERAAYDPAAKPDHPVTLVTWAQARAFCSWRGKRLPTEAEWEKAARGVDGRKVPWDPALVGNLSSLPCEAANTGHCRDETGSGGPHAVGSHPTDTSPFGALDMGANVSEWVADFYHEDYYASAPDENPKGPANGTHRLYRGNSYASSGWDVIRVSDRPWRTGLESFDAKVGIRCAYDELLEYAAR